MNREIERKFLVDVSKLPNLNNYPKYEIIQGYLSTDPVVRVRTTKRDYVRSGYLTIKGPGLGDHLEFEKSIGYDDAVLLMPLSKNTLKKIRYLFPVRDDKNLTWEIDFFEDENFGLVIAELEIPENDYQFEKPEWCLEEVTLNSMYSNSNLSNKPFKYWNEILANKINEHDFPGTV